MATIIDQMMDSLDEQQHMSLLKGRYLEEGLSRLELKSRHASLARQVTEAEDSAGRTMLELELGIVARELEETEPAAPTPDQVAAKLAVSNPAAAEVLKHQIGVESVRREMEDAQEAVFQANEDGISPESPSYQRLVEALDDAQRSYDEKRATVPPSFDRKQQASARAQTAEALRAAAGDLLDSPEPHLVKQGEEMLEQADEHDAQALTLRAHVPAVDAADTYADGADASGVDEGPGRFERFNKLVIGRMRGNG